MTAPKTEGHSQPALSEQRGRVIALEGALAVVEVAGGGCGRCHEKGGCGGQNLAQMLCTTPRRYRLENPYGALSGEEVVIFLPSGVLRRYATLTYVFPVIFLIFGAWVGDVCNGNLGAVIGSGVSGLLAWLFLRTFARRTGNFNNKPYIRPLRLTGG